MILGWFLTQPGLNIEAAVLKSIGNIVGFQEANALLLVSLTSDEPRFTTVPSF